MKYLMYRDWSGFELFFIEILKCTSLPALRQISHRFETFLMTLFREVQKRSILQNALPREPPRSREHGVRTGSLALRAGVCRETGALTRHRGGRSRPP